MGFVMPSKREAGVIMNSDLAKEWDGNKTILSDGTEIGFNPPPPKPSMPDWSEIKAIRHYFNRTYKNNFWPAWLYNHISGEERVVKNENEAAELGVCYRDRSADEEARFGSGKVWDWQDGCQWRPTPKSGARKYDPRRQEQGKEYRAADVPASTANRELLNTVLPEVTAAVVAALRQDSQVGKDVAPELRDEFLAFLAWKKTQAAIDQVAPALTGAVEETDERAAWLAQAETMGIKVDGRWSTERLKTEVEKAA